MAPNNNKKYHLILLLLLLCLSLSACACEEDEANTEISEPKADYSDLAEKIEISEIMTKNHTGYRTEDGKYPDWIELHNNSEDDFQLDGWALSDENNTFYFSDITLRPGEYYLAICSKNSGNGLNFSLKSGENLVLSDPDGKEVKRVPIMDMEPDTSMALSEKEEYSVCTQPTPGFENSKSGYLEYAAHQIVPQTLIINEVMVSNSSYAPLPDNQFCDWVEIKNNSSEEIQLSDYYLSNKNDDRLLWQFPEKTLSPGEMLLVYCGDVVVKDDVFRSIKASDYIIAPLSLSCTGDSLWLTDKNLLCVDSVVLRNIPVNGSYGRMENAEGFFFFQTATPNKQNTEGKRFVTESPKASQCSGVYDGITEISLELYGDGEIYYTLDSSVPTARSQKYTVPISLDHTTIVRAVCIRSGECTSRVANFSYIINENHTLPVLSLINDSSREFDGMFDSGTKGIELPAHLALYENGEERFNQACGVTLKGWTSLRQPKKSLGVYFRGKYGDGNVKNCDLFDTGITEYDSLSIRAGQDYRFSVIRNELMQELCLAMTDKVPTQHSKYCILYVDGEYYGLFCLKENMNEQFYADWAGVSKDSVITQRGPAALKSEAEQLLTFAAENDMTEKENYEYFCSKFDIDNIIDWLILEGYSANTDTQGNIRYFKSQEGDGKYRIGFYDLDWSLENDDAVFYNMLKGFGNSGYQIYTMTVSLFRNEEFKDKFLKRYAEVSKDVLSDENVLAMIDQLAAVVEPEIERDFPTWGVSITSWAHRVDLVRNFVNRNYSEMTVNIISSSLKLSDEERAYYFG